jgi:hypothetical protein
MFCFLGQCGEERGSNVEALRFSISYVKLQRVLSHGRMSFVTRLKPKLTPAYG